VINSYQFIEGTPGVAEVDIQHLIIPGRFRGPNGLGISEITRQRVDTAAAFFIDHVLDGFIICSGYKNPADHDGQPWRDELGAEFEGQPEAYGMHDRLRQIHSTIRSRHLLVDPHSIDTVSNLARSQRLLTLGNAEQPVGIVAQAAQLSRILDIIAPHTMRQPYAGILVPEIPGQPDTEPRGTRLASRWIVRGLRPDMRDNDIIAERRVLRLHSALSHKQTIQAACGRKLIRKSERTT
jgi:hypothetical protein